MHFSLHVSHQHNHEAEVMVSFIYCNVGMCCAAKFCLCFFGSEINLRKHLQRLKIGEGGERKRDEKRRKRREGRGLFFFIFLFFFSLLKLNQTRWRHMQLWITTIWNLRLIIGITLCNMVLIQFFIVEWERSEKEEISKNKKEGKRWLILLFLNFLFNRS